MKKFLLATVFVILSGCNANFPKTKEEPENVISDTDVTFAEMSDEEIQAAKIFSSTERKGIGYFRLFKYNIEPHEEPYVYSLNLDYEGKKSTATLFELPPTENEQSILLSYDKFVIKTALVNNEEIIKKNQVDLNEFVGYQIHASAVNPLISKKSFEISGKTKLAETDFYINDRATYKINDEEFHLIVQYTMEVTK